MHRQGTRSSATGRGEHMEGAFHAQKVTAVVQTLHTSLDTGLSQQESAERLVTYGKNVLEEKAKISPLKIFIEQFKGLLMYLLFGAAVLSYVIGEHIDAFAILAVLLLNGILGFVQEYKAEKALDALKKLESSVATVTRDGRDLQIPTAEVVPGDIITLNEGDKTPADARLFEVFSLAVDESILTGESVPVNKHTNLVKAELTLPDRKNMVFSGTLVTKGRGKAVVIGTGSQTQIGKIATLVTESQETETPLQMTLEKLGKILGLMCIGIALPGLILGILKGREWVEMVMTTISLAVSAIPEGLPVVVTIALAIGTRRMVKRGVLIRRLPAVEALGSTDVICSDKTGTITLNKMTVTHLYFPGMGNIHVKGEGTVGTFINDKQKKIATETMLKDQGAELLINAGILCNDADLTFGDPTERALLVLGEKLGISTETVDKTNKRLDEIPFDSANKYMVTLNQVGKQKLAFIKGAPEVVLKTCTHSMSGKVTKALTEKAKQELLAINAKLSAQSLRVLAVGYKQISKDSEFKKLNQFVFLGFVGMIDPPRQEVAGAVKKCNQAGIRVSMITGDHPLTAKAIARQIGLSFNSVITGVELDTYDDAALQKLVEKESVFARVSPEHKLRILRSLQANGHMVAMTGDGVNDAPALKEANIGIAVGSGSDLAREISDMVLLDDNFATIAKAVEEGRGIFFNIKKFIKFLIAANFDEILVIFSSIVLGTPLPFLPIHLLWLNLATDSLPALALAMDNYEPDLMQRKPYDPKKEIMHGVLGFSVLAGVLAYLATMGTFGLEYGLNQSSLAMAQTMVFTVTVLFEFFIVFSCRSDKSAFSAGIFSNKYLLGAVAVGLLMQIFAVYFPPAQVIFKTQPITLDKLPELFAFAASGFVIIETYRLVRNFLQRSPEVAEANQVKLALSTSKIQK